MFHFSSDTFVKNNHKIYNTKKKDRKDQTSKFHRTFVSYKLVFKIVVIHGKHDTRNGKYVRYGTEISCTNNKIK